MSTTTTGDNTDPLLAAANTAWLEYAKGTWSETDRRIFVEGFRRGSKAGAMCAYENAAVIAEGCSQDDAARDEPFRIAQTIREVANGRQ